MTVRYFNVDFYYDFSNKVEKALIQRSFYYSDTVEMGEHIDAMVDMGYDYVISREGQWIDDGKVFIETPYVNYSKKVYGREASELYKIIKSLENY